MRLLISGRVQGVGFRASMAKKAASIGDLRGHVRNLPDGRVEALVQGESAAVDQLILWAKQGPLLARVDDVEVQACLPGEDLGPFRQIRDA